MRIIALGVRGMPNVSGGVETHAEQLYRQLAALGCDVEVIVRSRFVPATQEFCGPIRLKRIWAPSTPGLETFVHSMLGVLYAAVARPDVLHIHAIGPAIVTPIARLLGLRVVVTHHGPDYDRDKWGPVARVVLRVGERLGMQWANARIVISQVIRQLVEGSYRRECVVIPNGVLAVERRAEQNHLLRFGLEPRRYLLQVSRLVPEKRQIDLIQAFALARLPGWKLALVGGLDDSKYCQELEAAAASTENVVLTGFLTGEPLEQIYSHASLFVLPSTHEGLPIALLEALSYGLPVIASDIPANLELSLNESAYFRTGSVPDLARALRSAVQTASDEEARIECQRWVRKRYDWADVAARTFAVFRDVIPEFRTAFFPTYLSDGKTAAGRREIGD